jgi:Ca-activated chloride channel family protein
VNPATSAQPGWRPRPRQNSLALAISAVAAIVISVVIGWVNHDCLDLVVASSNEKFVLLREIAATYPAPAVDRRCVSVRVIQKASGAAERSLRRDWLNESSSLPRPDVWSPAATTWLILLSQHRKDDGLPALVPPVAQSVMQSPLIIAMPQQMADVVHQAFGPRVDWDQIFELAQDQQGWARYGKPSWGSFKLGKTNPTISTSGLHALIGVNNAAQSAESHDEFLRKIESTVVHYGDSVGTFLSNLYAADHSGAALAYVSAIAVEEKQAFDYNRGNPRSDVCRPTCPFLPPIEKLVAIYPTKGTLIADHPYAILEWTDPAHRQAALDFQRYLETPAVQRLFQTEGFRDHRGEASEVLALPYFNPSGPKTRWLPPDSPELVEMLGLWAREFRKPAHALFVLDVGRSMLDPAAGSKETKLEVAIRASSNAFAELAPHDGIGLWTFPTTDGSPYKEASPPTTLAGDTAELIRAQAGLRTSSDEASFYATVRASVERVRSSFVPGRINAVVILTGGGYALNETRAFADLIGYLQNQPEERRVRVFMISYNSPSTDVMKQIAEASGGVLYEVTGQVNIGDTLLNAMSNF